MEIGIIGLGGISGLHMDVLNSIKNINVKCVFDIDKKAIELFQNQYPACKKSSSLDEFVQESLDIVAVLTPPKTHFELINSLIDKGVKNIFCEKPLVLNINELKKLYARYQKDNSKIFIGQSYRFFPHILEMKKYICEKNENLRNFNIEYKKPIEKIKPLDGWRSKYEGYVIQDNGVHLIDLLRFVTDDDVKVLNAIGGNTSNRIRGFDFASLNLKLNKGGLGNILFNHNSQNEETLYSGEHNYFFENYSLHLTRDNLKAIDYEGNETVVLPKVKEDWFTSFTNMWLTFLENIKHERTSRINIENNYNTVSSVCKSVDYAKKYWME